MNNHTHSNNLKAWSVCFAAAFYFFFTMMQMGLFNAINHELISYFTLTASQISSIAALFFYINALVLLPVGLLYDRLSTKKIILFSMVLTVGSALLFSVMTNMTTLMIYRAMSGIGHAFAVIGLIRMITLWFPASRNAWVTGILFSFGLFGGVFSTTPFVLLYEAIGWQQAMLVNGIVGSIMVILMLFLLRDPIERHALQEKSDSSGWLLLRHLQQAITVKQNWYCGLYAGLINLPIPILASLWGNSYLIQTYNLSTTLAASISSMLFIGLIIGCPVMGWLSDKFHLRKPFMMWPALISLLFILIIMYVNNLNVISLFTLFFLLGFMVSGNVIAFPTTNESNPFTISSTAMGLVNLLFGLVAGLAQPIFGFLIDYTWDGTMDGSVRVYSAANFHFALWLLPVVFIVAFLLAYKLRETHCKPVELYK